MGRHSDQTKSGHNIKFASKWWKNSWLLLSAVVALILIIFWVTFSVILNNSVTDNYAQNLFEAGSYEDSAVAYGQLAKQAETDQEKAEALLKQGQSLLYTSSFEEAYAVLEEAESLFESIGDSNGMRLARQYIQFGENTVLDPTNYAAEIEQPELSEEELAEITQEL